MKFSKSVTKACVLTMSLLISNLPNVALAEKISSEKMISAEAVLAGMTRAEAEKNVLDYLQRNEVQSELVKHGVAPDEAAARLASLSDAEVNQLAMQAKKAQAGGDILVAVLLVVLIIYFAKRI
jgi:hypothetical protein